MSTSTTTESPLDHEWLDKRMNQSKSRIFKGQDSAFLGALMCTQEFLWDESCGTAYTNGRVIGWNPRWFAGLPPATRDFINLHEIWHVAFCDMIRGQGKDPDRWNIACDYRINNMLRSQGYTNEGFDGFFDLQYEGMSAEQIYDLLPEREEMPEWMKKLLETLQDLKAPADPNVRQQIINNLVIATQQSKAMGGGKLPGELEVTLKRFLKPKINWKQWIERFFIELSDEDYTWARPNRRYQDMYLPSRQESHDGLAHLAIVEDTSGSMSNRELLRVNSEFKYLKETYNPELITLVQFDTDIRDVKVFKAEDPFDEIVVKGRGGTDLECVRDWIVENRPTAVIVFSDLDCDPMEKLPFDVPILWIGINDRGAKVNEGDLIRIKE